MKLLPVGDCSIDSQGNATSDDGADVLRSAAIDGIVDWLPGYAWQDLGDEDDDTGLGQSFTDFDIVDGVDYTYTITAYDRGVKPDTSLMGHYGAVSSNSNTGFTVGTWDPTKWVRDLPLYTFHDTMHVDSVYFYRLNHEILESFIIGPDTDLNPYDAITNPDVYVNDEEITENTHFFKLETPEAWDGFVSASDIEAGVGSGWNMSRGATLTNPYGYPS